MIPALYRIGQYARTKQNNQSELDQVIENPNEKNRYNKVIFLKFSVINDVVKYDNFDLEEFTDKKLQDYLYKKGTAAGGNFTPTLIVDSKNVEKSFRNLMKPIRNIDSQLFVRLYEYLKEEINFKLIVDSIKEILNSKEGYILTLKINGKTLNEFPEVARQLLSENSVKYYEKYNTVSKANQKYCFVCGEKALEVFGFVNTYNFYTVDKMGMVTSGFDQSMAWRNYPVCAECSETLEAGKKYLKSNLSNQFAGLKYFVIPKLSFDLNNSHEIFEDLENKIKFSLSKEKRKALMRTEGDILEALEEMQNYMAYNFLIYEEEKSAFSILLYIEDVLPSRIKHIFEIKEEVEKINLFRRILGLNGEDFDLFFTFELLREKFFPNNKFDGNWDKNFLEVLNSVFTNKKIDYQFIIAKFMVKIRKDYLGGVYITVLSSLLIFMFVQKMELFKNKNLKEEKAMPEMTEENKIYMEFLESHPDVFDTDTKKAGFLTGILTKNLLDLPEQRVNKPFYSRLNGMKIDEKILKRVFVEVQNKLNEYKKNYYSKLEALAGEYLTYADFKTISDNELSYYFVLGMNLNQKFKNKENKEKEEA